MASYAHPEVLVSTDWVKENLGSPSLRVVEVDLDTQSYDSGHIAGAVAFSWRTQLQDSVQRDIIGKGDFEKLMAASGISPDDTVVLYGDTHNWFATYAFWLFKLYGHEDVRLMDGGRFRWVAEKSGMLTTDRPVVAPTSYQVSQMDGGQRALLPQVMEAIQSEAAVFVDVRSDEEFNGQDMAWPRVRDAQQRGGHIPGAKHIPCALAIASDATFRPVNELRNAYGQLTEPAGRKPTIAYCRLGLRSSHTWFVLKYLLGFDVVKNYDGSWAEYGNLVGAPIERAVKD